MSDDTKAPNPIIQKYVEQEQRLGTILGMPVGTGNTNKEPPLPLDPKRKSERLEFILKHPPGKKPERSKSDGQER